MFSNTRSLIAALFLSSVAVGTPTMAGTENWFTFFRELFSLSDYETILEDQKKIHDDLERKDMVILSRLETKKKTLEALICNEITHLEAAACFHHCRMPESYLPNSVEPGLESLSSELQSCINLVQWVKGSGDECQILDPAFEQFCQFVKSKMDRKEAVTLPLPPVHLIAESLY